MSFTCPCCGAVSHHPKDEEFGYCGNCHDFTGGSTSHAELQLWFDVRRAADQMAVANWREAHPGNDLVIPDHGDLVIWMLDQLATQHRLERVDTSLAKRVSEHMRRDAALHLWLNNWLASYPLDIFPEPDLTKAAELLKSGGLTLDSVSANMGRHVLTRVLEFIDGLKTA